MSEHHDLRSIAVVELPMVLADLHDRLPEGAAITVAHHDDRVADLLVGAGFVDVTVARHADRWRAVNARSLADTVGPTMRLLVCGLNPSLHAADAGVGFVSPSNRFWPAARRAGLVSVDRDPRAALAVDGVGMTDLVKRATTKAAELAPREYRDGLPRLDALCDLFAPAVVCVVGLTGWRAAVDRGASAGMQQRRLGPSPVVVVPSTSGLNARTSMDDLVAAFERVADLARG